MANALKLDSGSIEVTDSSGDLWLNISSVPKVATTPNTCRLFLVSSRTLSQASRIFDKMIRQNPKNAHKSSTPAPREPHWVIDLYSDDIPTMRIVLGYIHSRPRDVPSFKFFDEHPDQFIALYRLAIWADKYDCAQSFKYLTVGWLNCLNDHIVYESGCCGLHILRQTAWVAWVFGNERAFKKSRDTAFMWYQSHKTDSNILQILSTPSCETLETDDADASSALQAFPGFLTGGKLTQEQREHFKSRRKALGIAEHLRVTPEQDALASPMEELDI